MGSDRRTRIIAIVATPIIVVGLVVVLFVVFGTSQETSPATVSAGSPGLDMTLPLVPSPTSEQDEIRETSPTPTAVPVEEIVAQVNDRIIPVSFLELASASDRAINSLVGGTYATQNEIIEVLVNGELVWQQAEQDGYVLEFEEVNTALENFLESNKATLADLESELSNQGLKLDDFQAYFWRLLTINGYSNLKSRELGITGIEYVSRLQSQARVSFGPAAKFSQEVAPGENEPSPSQDQVEASEGDETEIAPGEAPRGTRVGQLAPAFDLPTLNTPEVERLSSMDFLGKPLLLSFWTTWCPFCRVQTPFLVEAYSRYGEAVQFVGVNVEEEQYEVHSYLQEHHIAYPILMDLDRQVADLYHVTGFPTTYFIDPDGVVVYRQVGQLKPDQLEKYIEQLLAVSYP